MRTSWTSSGARHGLSDRSDATAVPGFIASPALAASLRAVLVDLIELHLQSKQAHWNVVGHNFRDLHPQPGEIIDIARDGSDTIAERLHALHATAGGRSGTVAAGRPATDGLMPVESQGRHAPAGQPTMNLPVIRNVLSNLIAVRAATGV